MSDSDELYELDAATVAKFRHLLLFETPNISVDVDAEHGARLALHSPDGEKTHWVTSHVREFLAAIYSLVEGDS
jgi:hypothetical protein